MQRILALSVVAAIALTACGSDDDASSTPNPKPDDDVRTIEVSMTDNAYAPSSFTAAAGETVRFVFRNDGSVRHEAVFGSLDEQLEHHAEMAEAGHDMHGDVAATVHDDPHAVVVEPGATTEVTHTFDETGVTVIGCHEPGHWEAGMRLDVEVT